MNNVGKTIPHDSAMGHVTGKADYIEDIPRRSDELWVSMLGSPVAAGRISALDLEPARTTEGVVDVVSRMDVPGNNVFGAVLHDEPFLADEEVLYLGQPVAVVAAETREALTAAIEAVRLEVEETHGTFTIAQARTQNRFIGPSLQIARGHLDTAMQDATHRLNGTFHTAGQDQFYFESQAALAFPDEQGQLVVHSSTQNTTEIQAVVAEVLGLGHHQVVCVCKRMGGAFGGKETQAAIPALMAAIVAHRTGRAARVVYDKDLDMQVTGKRHAYETDWDVGFDERGTICALRLHFFSSGGAAADLSTSVMERTMLHAENSYFIPHIEINGRVCFTNLPPNTAFRGFGGPQAKVAMENVIHEIAAHLKTDAYDIQSRNLYGVDQRNITPYGQHFRRNHLPEILRQLARSCQYQQRRVAIESANQTSRLTLRGIAMAPMKFGISFTTTFLNQGNALVNVYADGTVQVSTGGTEMGQGLNTKIRQLVADEFGLPWSQVRLMPTSTEKNNNTPPTAASAGTDLNGAAAVKACRKITSRLRALAAERLSNESSEVILPEQICFSDSYVHDANDTSRRIPFGQLTSSARRARIDLGARAFFATPGIDFDRESGQGSPFLYFTQGAAVAEVEIDRFTGGLTVPRVDLLIDIGKSINPGVDRGQITGGFIQGMGWVTAECLVYDQRGALLSYSPTTYKIPAITDVPPIFNCTLFDNDDNVENIARSKAVGEPPLMLAIAVWSAVKQALRQANPAGAADLRVPATHEEILRCLEFPAPEAELARHLEDSNR
jgi:xanthine dehydrogenase large subunit